MSNEQFDSVWDAVEGTPQESENMLLRRGLMMALAERITAEALTQKQAAVRLGVTRRRISGLVRGRIDLFSEHDLRPGQIGQGIPETDQHHGVCRGLYPQNNIPKPSRCEIPTRVSFS